MLTADANCRVFPLYPIQSTENMLTAQKRDAATKGLFYFRKTVTPPESDTEDETDGMNPAAKDLCCHDDEYCLMSANTIINGKVGPRAYAMSSISLCALCVSVRKPHKAYHTIPNPLYIRTS